MARIEAILRGIDIAREQVAQVYPNSRVYTMKYWLLACSALALVAAHAAYTFSNRQSRRRGGLTDQVSSEWLATAKIHAEDHNR